MISDHTAHILGLLIIFVAVATWTAAMVIKWAGDAVADHVAAALNDFDDHVHDALCIANPPITEAALTHDALQVVAEAERVVRGAL
jgi:hypothetical protein